ncbi:hypothetical protein SDC9_89645 [bioreactor metagenome]|uniref:HTH LytTR-type domain-containing protein n=1 Tax=bioreactor metagenome TaxID=1076179 RepID=A0A644ZWF5_9ZZZZ|nr:LytTR family DNA-binding domain-containing protein [Oscillospiraceae bacterium]
MNVKLLVSSKNYKELEKYLKEKGIQVDDDAEFILSESKKAIDSLIGKNNGIIYRIETEDIIYIESFGHDVILHTKDQSFNLSERLYILENLLDPVKFIRISNSVIISKNKIVKITPTFSSKFILTLADGSNVDVTRSYYCFFKEHIGI